MGAKFVDSGREILKRSVKRMVSFSTEQEKMANIPRRNTVVTAALVAKRICLCLLVYPPLGSFLPPHLFSPYLVGNRGRGSEREREKKIKLKEKKGRL